MHNNEEHIAFEDMEKYTVAIQNLTELNKQFLIEIDNKVDICEICETRFNFYFESTEILANFDIDKDEMVRELELVVAEGEISLLEKTLGILKKFSTNDILNDWLENGKQLMGRLQDITYLSPALATRGSHKVEKLPEIIFSIVLDEEGFFQFTLQEEKTIKIKVPIQSDFGTSLCVVILHQDDLEHSEVYPLIVAGDKGMTPNITLSKGNYLLCIPTK